MSEYLSKEEIKQWRSSLEKITLEEFAARLGKKIESKKETNDLVDIVLHGQPVVSNESDWKTSKIERLSAIADRAMEREKEIYSSPFSIKNLNEITTSNSKKTIEKSNSKKTQSTKVSKKDVVKPKKNIVERSETKVKSESNLKEEVHFVFKKSLTDREQKVLEYFISHKNSVVYAKDLAELLDLPRDYIYKYIKNLRAKIEGETLQNADKGGFILNV